MKSKAPVKFPELNEKTFLDLTNSKAINVPYYNHDNKTFEISRKLATRELTLEEAIKESLNLYAYWKKKYLKN